MLRTFGIRGHEAEADGVRRFELRVPEAESREQTPMSTTRAVLKTEKITKRFPGLTAIDSLDFSMNAGEIRAIMGENGAGKSTFCNMVTGIYTPDEGKVFFDGREVRFTHPRQALDAGISMVYQERNLIPFLNGAESICLGLEERRLGCFIDNRQIRRVAEAVRERVGADVPLDRPVGRLSPAQQQMVEILRAVVHEPKLLILDEPTASLGGEEAEKLFAVMRQLKEHNVGVILISHKLNEVFAVCDSVSIFRNGKHIITDSSDKLDRASCVQHMLGRDMSSQYPPVVSTRKERVLLEARDLTDHAGRMDRFSFKVHEGEVVGLYGLLGAGRTEIAETVFGLGEALGGTVLVGGEAMPPRYRATEMIKRGVMFIPEDRRSNGLFTGNFGIKENLTLPSLSDVSGLFGLISRRRENAMAEKISSFESLRIKCRDYNQSVSELSGGNQQKVLIGRWIFHKAMRMLIMDEPTQGIDVGVKHDIYKLIRDLAADGVGILMISSDLPELTGVCDRLYVIGDGKRKAELGRKDFDDEKILEMVL